MRSFKRVSAVVAVSALGTVGFWALGGCPVSNEMPGTNEVLMQNIAFVPKEITIRAGETVTWRNTDLVPHTATSGNPGEPDIGSVFRVPDEGLLGPGGTGTVTFSEPGEFIYFCEVHPGMMRDAKVIVLAAGQ